MDTNILVYAHRESSLFHKPALACLVNLAERKNPWAIPWHCMHEFLAVVTHTRIYAPPTPLEMALNAVEVWINAPSCRMIGEGPGYMEALRAFAATGRVTGGMIHDARIVATCLHNGVDELWSADRDFSRFTGIKIVNPLLA